MNARMLMWYATSLVAIAMIVNLYMLFYMRCGQEPFFSDGKKTFESRIASAKMLGSSEYSVVEYPNFLSGAECARIIKVARVFTVDGHHRDITQIDTFVQIRRFNFAR